MTPDRMAESAPLASSYPAITLWQPYASLIAVAAKPFETRSWPAPGHLIGQRVAIHAATRRPTRAEVGSLDQDCADAFGFCHWEQHLPYGAVVCLATLAGSYRVTGNRGLFRVQLDGHEDIEDDLFGDYTPGRYCWELTDVQRLQPAVLAKGAQGWWTWRPGLMGAIALAPGLGRLVAHG